MSYEPRSCKSASLVHIFYFPMMFYCNLSCNIQNLQRNWHGQLLKPCKASIMPFMSILQCISSLHYLCLSVFLSLSSSLSFSLSFRLPWLCVPRSLALALTYTHTHREAHTHAPSHTQTHIHTHSSMYTLSLAISLSLTHTRTPPSILLSECKGGFETVRVGF